MKAKLQKHSKEGLVCVYECEFPHQECFEVLKTLLYSKIRKLNETHQVNCCPWQ